jgi:nucleoside-diphosphate-sugar epimerase
MNEIIPNKSKQRVALVTGATGFVGSHLARRLVQDGWEVHILSRDGSHLPDASEFSQVINHIHDGSTEDMVRCVALAKPDLVFHLASLFLSQHATKDIDALIQSNVLFGNQLLEAMKVNEVSSLINTGTSWQHYNNDDYNPVCLYAATKQAFEAILEYYVQACGIKAITLELFDTYGPDDPRPKLFHLLSKTAESGETLDMSAGEQLIDLVHIDDVVEAYLIAAQRLLDRKISMHERYAVSSGSSLPLKELVQLYAEVTKQTIAVNWGARPYRHREVMLPWNRGTAIAGWVPKIALEDGLVGLNRMSNYIEKTIWQK